METSRIRNEVVYENKEGLCCSTRRLIGSSRSRAPRATPWEWVPTGLASWATGRHRPVDAGAGRHRHHLGLRGGRPPPHGRGQDACDPQWASMVHLCPQHMNLIRAPQMPSAPLRPNILAPSPKERAVDNSKLPVPRSLAVVLQALCSACPPVGFPCILFAQAYTPGPNATSRSFGVGRG